MAQTIQEFINSLKKGEVPGISVGDLRNTFANSGATSGKIRLVKKEKGHYFNFYVLKQIALPFDPLTMSTEKHNRERPYSPAKPASAVVLGLKSYYNENPEMKQLFMAKVGVESWDTTAETITDEDFAIFNKYTEPFRYNYRVVSIKNETLTGSKYGANYLVDISKNEVGDLEDEWIDAQGNKKTLAGYTKNYLELSGFLKSAYLNEYYEWEASKEGKNADSARKSAKKMDILSQSPFGGDRFKRELLVFYLVSPEATGEVYSNQACLDTLASDDMKYQIARLSYRADKMDTVFAEFKTKYAKRDIHLDFYETTMSVPNIPDDLERGKNTTFSSMGSDESLASLKDEKYTENLKNCIIEKLLGYDDLDKAVMASGYDKPLSEELVDLVFQTASDTIDVNKLILKENTVKFYEGLIETVWAEKATKVLAKLDNDLLTEGGVTEVSKEMKETMQFLADNSDIEEIDDLV